MQPYQEASEEMIRQGELPLKTLKTAGSLAATAYGGGAALNRVFPLLSQYIPKDIMTKGLSKIDPRYGSFINKALQEGTPIDEIKNFIKEKAESSKSQAALHGKKKNIISQYSDDLDEFLKNQIAEGRSPDEAGALAQVQEKGKWTKAIAKMEADHKAKFSEIVNATYGSQNKPEQQQQRQSQAALQQPIQRQQQQPQQGGGDEQLIASIKKILSM